MPAHLYRTNCVERFLDYVKIDTQSREGSDTYPRTPGQWDLLRKLVDELKTLGLDDVTIDEHGYVFATISATSSKVPDSTSRPSPSPRTVASTRSTSPPAGR